MEKMDYKKKFKHLYRPSAKKVDVVDVPEWNYLMVDGKGNPNTSQAFQDAINALYPISFTLKFMVKKGKIGVDYVVMPLEGLWWADDMSSFDVQNKDNWKWTLMIMQPEFITKEMVQEAIKQVEIKKNPAALSLVHFKTFKEGKAAQIMHIGPFSEEGPTVEKVHSFITDHKSQRRGKHHEIYLSDMRRAAPENLKTIIRQPMS